MTNFRGLASACVLSLTICSAASAQAPSTLEGEPAAPIAATAEQVEIPVTSGSVRCEDLFAVMGDRRGELFLQSLSLLDADPLNVDDRCSIPLPLIKLLADVDGTPLHWRYDSDGEVIAMVIDRSRAIQAADRWRDHTLHKLHPRTEQPLLSNLDSSLIVKVGDKWPTDGQPAGRIVLVLGGYRSIDSSPAAFASPLSEAVDAAVAIYYYPTEQSVEISGQTLANAISGLPGGVDVTLVAHSMGGLVARWAVEIAAPEQTERVDQLIQICPPNHGSVIAELAELQSMAKLLDGLPQFAPLSVETIVGLLEEGFGEAALELRPGSETLQSLNSRPRRDGVRYSIIAGDAGLVSPWWKIAYRVGRRQRELPQRLEESIELAERYLLSPEMTTGQGDGVVSLSSARLAGVDDFIVLPHRHNDWTTATPALVEEVASRIRKPVSP